MSRWGILLFPELFCEFYLSFSFHQSSIATEWFPWRDGDARQGRPFANFLNNRLGSFHRYVSTGSCCSRECRFAQKSDCELLELCPRAAPGGWRRDSECSWQLWDWTCPRLPDVSRHSRIETAERCCRLVGATDAFGLDSTAEVLELAEFRSSRFTWEN